jgi:tetratricopeptide (TPR) repeat protein
MSDEANPEENIDARLNRLEKDIYGFRKRCHFTTMMRTAQEARRLAHAHRRLIPYLTANFYVMNSAHNTLAWEAGREAAVQNIALLESPDAAAHFQGDFDRREYDQTVQWMSACSYDNLATATGHLQGYNSTGMQACIADGIGVCRRTGKLKCIACFREYATRVFRAADDLPMAMHHARTNVNRPPDKSGNDRRWVGARDEADLLLLTGRLAEARAAVQRASDLVPTYHSPLSCGRETEWYRQFVDALIGDGAQTRPVAAAAGAEVPRDEDADQTWKDDLLASLRASLAGEHDKAISLLAEWDRTFTSRQNVADWLETRLRLVAASRFAGQNTRAESLAKPLAEKAKAADDYLTLRRLKAVFNFPASTPPFPTVEPITTATTVAASAPAPVDSPATPDPAALDAPSTMQPLLDELRETLIKAVSAGQSDLSAPLEKVLSIPPETITDWRDVGRLLQCLAFLCRTKVPAGRVWNWVNTAAKPHPDHGRLLASMALIGLQLRAQADPAVAETIPVASLEAMTRRAVDVDPNDAAVFGRAGTFFLETGNVAEAERMLARSFRLDRRDPAVARQLSDLYSRSDRAVDALATLDMCIRDGVLEPDLLWHAALLAQRLGRHDSTLAYLDSLAKIQTGRRWLQYHRAVSLLAVNRFAEAGTAVDAEAALAGTPGATYVHAVKAAAAAGTGDTAAASRHIAAGIAVPLHTITDLTVAGIAAGHRHLWAAAQSLPPNDQIRTRLVTRLLSSGLTPPGFWDDHRKSAEVEPAINHYRVLFDQPVDPARTADGHTPVGQENWTRYLVQYGVLAPDEETAKAIAAQWQSRSASLPAEVVSVTPDGGPYKDRRGVTERSRFEEPAE